MEPIAYTVLAIFFASAMIVRIGGFPIALGRIVASAT
jgi:hypothetical protein